ncbi:type I restriction enzyme specificity chain-like protein [Fimbriimonas ginsengisoli Gsoil 348]|uniref:Type I restriction enzyme specificity chain-like protein n=1 Tax=Fimbriimonas ginsengisoli Gsoil 348 TaxID=661478 RepID=A0A068NTH8_FIMGI|nr:type I restriction enzyme specificity chain-like protein [Fimbriimonas ginsengisoli Gsoil 348]
MVGWTRATLENLGPIRSGSTPSRRRQADYFDGGTIPWIKTGDLTNGPIWKTEEKITELALRESSCIVVEPNSVLIAMYGGFNQIGRTGLTTAPCALNQAISAITVDTSIADPKFVLSWLNANLAAWKRIAASSRKDPNITRLDICRFPIYLPQLPEQRAIVQRVEDSEAAVRAADALIERKVAYKKALAEDLLTGRRRFPGFSTPWRETKLGRFFAPKDDRAPTKTPLILSCSKVYGILPQSERFSKQLASVSNAHYRHIVPGDLVYDPMLLWDASIAFSDYEGIVSPAYETLSWIGDEHGDRRFFKALFKSDTMRYVYTTISQGTNARRRKAPVTDFLKVSLKIPEAEEQRRIADLLSALDEEILILRKQRDALNEQKKGLMQKLLTGEVRLEEFR